MKLSKIPGVIGIALLVSVMFLAVAIAAENGWQELDQPNEIIGGENTAGSDILLEPNQPTEIVGEEKISYSYDPVDWKAGVEPPTPDAGPIWFNKVGSDIPVEPNQPNEIIGGENTAGSDILLEPNQPIEIVGGEKISYSYDPVDWKAGVEPPTPDAGPIWYNKVGLDIPLEPNQR